MRHFKPSADIVTLTPKTLGEGYAKNGMNYNPYLYGTKQHGEFKLSYDAYLARTQPYGNNSTTR